MRRRTTEEDDSEKEPHVTFDTPQQEVVKEEDIVGDGDADTGNAQDAIDEVRRQYVDYEERMDDDEQTNGTKSVSNEEYVSNKSSSSFGSLDKERIKGWAGSLRRQDPRA